MTGLNVLAAKKALFYAAQHDLQELESMSNVESTGRYTKEEYRENGIVYIHHFYADDEFIFPNGKSATLSEAERYMDEIYALPNAA